MQQDQFRLCHPKEETAQAHLKPNAIYNLAAPNSLVDRLSIKVRKRMYNIFIEKFSPSPDHNILDIGVTSDCSYGSSNYFEALYPHKRQITAAGIDDAAFLETLYPGIKFVRADALAMPFGDGDFDLVHSSAVLEHVGSQERQSKMVAECLRVAKRGICITTPNRWFPIEFHTQLPLIHWLPKRTGRAVMRWLGYDFFAHEKNLNLLSRRDLQGISARHAKWKFEIAVVKLLGIPSNLMLFGYCKMKPGRVSAF